MITITDSAAQKIQTLLKGQPSEPPSFLRISVLSGGCSGFQYNIHLDQSLTPDDLVIEHPFAKVVIDDISLDLIKGAVLDYEDTLASSKFVIKNPNATTGCGCGKSFSI